jgi:DNA-binding CsgD family transcriptional regulator
MVTPKRYSGPFDLPPGVVDGLRFKFCIDQQHFAFYRKQELVSRRLEEVFQFDVGDVSYCLVRVDADAALASDADSPCCSSGPDPGPSYQLIDAVSAALAPAQQHLPVEVLTARELQIASLVALGRSNKQVSAELRISEWTVSSHIRRIFLKLGVGTRAEMVFKCATILDGLPSV